MGVLLLFFIAFRLKLAPLGGAYSTGVIPDWSSPAFIWDVVHHQLLPALALLLGSVGGWVLTMRGMGMTIQGEDYVNFAEHKGLDGSHYFQGLLFTKCSFAAGNRPGACIGHGCQFRNCH